MNISDDNGLDALRRAEREKLISLKEHSPELFTRSAPVNPDTILTRIGIKNLPERPKGYIRLLPQDFIVEERGSDDNLSTIEPQEPHTNVDPVAPTIYADLVKVGMGTPEAIQQAASLLDIATRQIGYAGLKDANALTSQKISLRKVDWQQVNDIAAGQQMFIKPKSTGKGAMSIGQLTGNRFTIFVRTENPADQQVLHTKATTLQNEGFANFYGVQRFGNRLLNPLLGKLLCQGRPEEATKIYLTEPGLFDTPLYKEVRKAASKHYDNWPAMKDVFDKLPYSFRNERTLLSALINYADDWPKLLASIEDQVRFWVYGYASYLVNHLLSRVLEEKASIPDPLPLPLGGPQTDQLYGEYLNKHDTVNYHTFLRPYSFVIQKERAISPWIVPQVHHVVAVPAGLVISFTLPKAAYATTFLMFLFSIYEGTPVPTWVRRDEIDSKAILGTGSAQQALEQFDAQV